MKSCFPSGVHNQSALITRHELFIFSSFPAGRSKGDAEPLGTFATASHQIPTKKASKDTSILVFRLKLYLGMFLGKTFSLFIFGAG
jgi:hypothetical protein